MQLSLLLRRCPHRIRRLVVFSYWIISTRMRKDEKSLGTDFALLRDIRHSNGIGKRIKRMSVTILVMAIVRRFPMPCWQLGGLMWSICQNLSPSQPLCSAVGHTWFTHKDNGRHSSIVLKKTPTNVAAINQCNATPDFLIQFARAVRRR